MLLRCPRRELGGGCVLRGKATYLLGRNGLLAGLMKLLDCLLVIPKILLATDEDDGETLAEVKNFGDPLRVGTCQSSVPYLQADACWLGGFRVTVPSPGRCRGNRGSQQRSR
jgi:hypothetical protein